MTCAPFSAPELARISALIQHCGEQLLTQQPRQVLPNLSAMLACLTQQSQIPLTTMKTELARLRPGIAFDNQSATSLTMSKTVAETDVCWLCEPIDGAVQYLHGQALWSISLCLLKQGQAEYTWVYQPATQTMYIAHKQHGAFRNQQRLACQVR